MSTEFTSSNKDLEGVMRRVQKLLAIAGDNRADPNEAAAAAAMAERIMRKYQLDHEEIIVNSLKTGDDLTESEHMAYSTYHKPGPNGVKRVPTWAKWLSASVGLLMDCGVRHGIGADGNACIRFYGLKADTVVAGWMFDYLVSTTKRLCKQWEKASKAPETERGAVASYRRGVALGIVNNLKILQQEKEIAAAEQLAKKGTTGTDLLVIKRDAIALRYGEFKYPQTKKLTIRDVGAFSQGKIDGDEVDLNVRGVSVNPTGPAPLMLGN